MNKEFYEFLYKLRASGFTHNSRENSRMIFYRNSQQAEKKTPFHITGSGDGEIRGNNLSGAETVLEKVIGLGVQGGKQLEQHGFFRHAHAGFIIAHSGFAHTQQRGQLGLGELFFLPALTQPLGKAHDCAHPF